jgi:O-antigen ligase
MFIHEPMLGVGYLHFSAQLPTYFHNTSTYDISAVGFSGLIYAHNTLLTVLSQTGLIGATLVGALIVMGWRRAWSAARIGNWAGESSILAFVGIGVCSVFAEPLFEPAVLAAFLLIVSTPRRADEFRNLKPSGHHAATAKAREVSIDA